MPSCPMRRYIVEMEVDASFSLLSWFILFGMPPLSSRNRLRQSEHLKNTLSKLAKRERGVSCSFWSSLLQTFNVRHSLIEITGALSIVS